MNVRFDCLERTKMTTAVLSPSFQRSLTPTRSHVGAFRKVFKEDVEASTRQGTTNDVRDNYQCTLTPTPTPTPAVDGLVRCPVNIVGDLRKRSTHKLEDKVQVFNFDEFDGLSEFMSPLRKESIESCDEETLEEVHKRFSQVVKSIVVDNRLYRTGLTEVEDPQVVLYATPSVRLAGSKYADYMHNDVIFADEGNADDKPLAMINIWFVLNDTPPSNLLMFHESKAVNTRMSHMLHANYDHMLEETLFYDKDMCWGSFYCFISGQLESSENMLLHAAVDVPGLSTEPRRSAEMRYIVKSNTTMNNQKSCPSQSSSADTDDHELGTLFGE
jgi:hypothetical protein